MSVKVERDAVILAGFADLLRTGVVAGASSSTLSGAASRACEARRTWRPTATKEPFQFLEIPDLPRTLLWRKWFSTPNRPVMVVVDEQLDAARMDVWCGVHGGTHLDHLSATNDAAPGRLEFGDGHLVAESVAMSAELLAGAEALAFGDDRVREAIADGLEERIGRLCLVGTYGNTGTYGKAVGIWSDEFCDLPVLSEAYVSGPLDLIRCRHRDRLVPDWISDRFEKRWSAAAVAHDGAADFLKRVFREC